MQTNANDFQLADEDCSSDQRFICLLGKRLNIRNVCVCDRVIVIVAFWKYPQVTRFSIASSCNIYISQRANKFHVLGENVMLTMVDVKN